MSGATGFIGRHLVYRLIERGDHVTALARNREKAEDLFGAHATVVTRLDDLPADTPIGAHGSAGRRCESVP